MLHPWAIPACAATAIRTIVIIFNCVNFRDALIVDTRALKIPRSLSVSLRLVLAFVTFKMTLSTVCIIIFFGCVTHTAHYRARYNI